MVSRKEESLDGSFEDWAGTETTLDGTDDSINGNIDIIETGITIDNVYTSSWLKLRSLCLRLLTEQP